MLTFIQLCQQGHKLSSNREQTVSKVFPRFVIVFAVIKAFRLNLSIRDLEALGGFNHFTPIKEVQPTRVWDLSIPGSVQLPSPTFCFIQVTTKYWFDDFSSADSRSSRRRRRHDCWTLPVTLLWWCCCSAAWWRTGVMTGSFKLRAPAAQMQRCTNVKHSEEIL